MTVGPPAPAPPPRTAGARPDLTQALASRVRTTPVGPLLAGRSADVVFLADRGPGATLELRPGGLRARRGVVGATPTATVRGALPVLIEVVRGQRSGVEAFLDGRIGVRGDLSLALALDGLLTPTPDRPASWPTADMVTVGGVRTAYLAAGDAGAPPVLLLHGLGATNASMLPLLANLALDHRVVAPDLPGFGGSDAPAVSYTAAWFASWLREFQHALGFSRAVLIGNSMGGRIALEAGLQAPQRVRALVLLCASPAFRRLRQWVPLARLARPGLARLPLPLSHPFVVAGIRSMFSDPDRLAPAWYDAAADEFLRVMGTPRGRVAFFTAARAIYLEDAFGQRGFWTRLPQLAPPAMFLWGDRDRLVPSGYARHVRDALPGAASLVLEDSGHVPQFEHPEQTATLIRAFLADRD